MLKFMETLLQLSLKIINITNFIKLVPFSPQIHLRKLSITFHVNVRTIVLFFTENMFNFRVALNYNQHIALLNYLHFEKFLVIKNYNARYSQGRR